jgi:hypothetical protein
VKDPTYPDPSLVMEVKYSSPTILQHIICYSVSEGRRNAQFLGFSSRRVHWFKGRYSIWSEEGALVAKTYWDLIDNPRAPFLYHFEEFSSAYNLLGSWHKL